MIPVTIVTGALGSGKTTLINHILTSNHGLKVGVIVNEFGSIGIDSGILMTTSEKLIELPNGCICCMVREDITIAALKLIKEGKIDYLVIETSGLAEPLPVAFAFSEPQIKEYAELDSIICVIDSENCEQSLKEPIARDQLQSSDIVILNKVDLASSITHTKSLIRKYSPHTQIIESVKCSIPVNLILGSQKFDPSKLKKEKKHMKTGFVSESFITGPVDPDKSQEFLENLPENIFRAKGILCIKESEKGSGDELRVSFQKVGKRTELEFTRPWQEGEKKETKLVFIGTKLDKKELKKSLEECK